MKVVSRRTLLTPTQVEAARRARHDMANGFTPILLCLSHAMRVATDRSLEGGTVSVIHAAEQSAYALKAAGVSLRENLDSESPGGKPFPRWLSQAGSSSHERVQAATAFAFRPLVRRAKKRIEQAQSIPSLPQPIREALGAASAQLKQVETLGQELMGTHAPHLVNPKQILQEMGHSIPLPAEVELKLILDDVPSVEGEPGKLASVVRNLLVNAVQALTPGHNIIELRLRTEGKEVVAEVMDTGCGIEPGRLGTLFQARSSTKANGEGLGLGNVWDIVVTSLHGQIKVRSGWHIEGQFNTVFEVRLPTAA